MSALPFDRKEYAARWDGVQAEMRNRQLGAAVVFGRSGGNLDRFQDIFYLTNYHVNQTYVRDGEALGYRAVAHAAIILEIGKEPLLVASEPDVDSNLVATTRNFGDHDLIAELAKRLKAEGIVGRTGFIGSDTISAKHFRALEELTPGIEWDIHDDLVLDRRVIKSPAELDVFRQGGEIISRAMTAMFEALQMGASESEAAGEAAREVYKGQGHVTNILISHGPQTAERLTDNPLAGYTSARPGQGDIVRAWIYGPAYQGYWLDPGRTTVIGLRPTPDQRQLVESCANIVEQCRAAIRPGVRAQDVAALGARLRDAFGGADDEMSNRWPIFGHGNGLFWDPPVISLDYSGKYETFTEGMVASTEAFLAIPGVGGAGFEQNFIVTKDGTELLTTTPMLWW